MEYVVGPDVGGRQQIGRGDPGEDDAGGHAGLLAHADVGLQPVTDDDAIRGWQLQPVEDGTRSDGRGFADDDLDRFAGAALDGTDDGRRVGEAAVTTSISPSWRRPSLSTCTRTWPARTASRSRSHTRGETLKPTNGRSSPWMCQCAPSVQALTQLIPSGAA